MKMKAILRGNPVRKMAFFYASLTFKYVLTLILHIFETECSAAVTFFIFVKSF